MFLSRESVFPIVRDAQGHPLSAATGLRLAGTIQGEGKLCGTAALFVRLQGCNLRCAWRAADGSASPCDTAHTWAAGSHPVSVDDVLAIIRANIGPMRHIVITGGEPYMQPEEVALLIDGLHADGLHVTIETNGSLVSDALSTRADLLSLSPKLSTSGLSDALRRQTVNSVLASVRTAHSAGRNVQLKFVYSAPSDEAEILSDYAEVLSLVAPSDVILMPLGATPQLLAQSTPQAVEAALRHGWRFGPRLHISLFGNKEGT